MVLGPVALGGTGLVGGVGRSGRRRTWPCPTKAPGQAAGPFAEEGGDAGGAGGGLGAVALQVVVTLFFFGLPGLLFATDVQLFSMVVRQVRGRHGEGCPRVAGGRKPLSRFNDTVLALALGGDARRR